MADTPKLGLPLIAASQAQKHVTMNESLYALDALMQTTVLDKDLSAPPGSPNDGDAYLVDSGASGTWVGQSGNVAAFYNGLWTFFVTPLYFNYKINKLCAEERSFK